MTSTPITVGLKEGRVSSRILRPPGGGHTDIFGGEPEPVQTGSRRRQFSHHNKEQGQTQVELAPVPEKPTNGTHSPIIEETIEPAPAPNAAEFMKAQESANSEPMRAPEPKEQEKPKDEPKMETAKRVRVPPGGFSSGLW